MDDGSRQQERRQAHARRRAREGGRQDRPRDAPLRGARPARAAGAVRGRLPALRPRGGRPHPLDRQAPGDRLHARRDPGLREGLPARRSSAPEASARVRALFLEKQQQIREQITQLQVIENDLTEALAYLDSLPDRARPSYAPTECGACDHHGHHKGEAPPLFAGLSKRSAPDDEDKAFDVPVTVLYREGNN